MANLRQEGLKITGETCTKYNWPLELLTRKRLDPYQYMNYIDRFNERVQSNKDMLVMRKDSLNHSLLVMRRVVMKLSSIIMRMLKSNAAFSRNQI